MSIAKFIQNLSHQTAHELTAELRDRALAHGWDKDVVDNMRVEYAENKMKVTVHPDYAERAFKHEFGTETTAPSAVIRKLGNDRSTSGVVISRALKGDKK